MGHDRARALAGRDSGRVIDAGNGLATTRPGVLRAGTGTGSEFYQTARPVGSTGGGVGRTDLLQPTRKPITSPTPSLITRQVAYPPSNALHLRTPRWESRSPLSHNMLSPHPSQCLHTGRPVANRKTWCAGRDICTTIVTSSNVHLSCNRLNPNTQIPTPDTTPKGQQKQQIF